jgi:hypothetical protein
MRNYTSFRDTSLTEVDNLISKTLSGKISSKKIKLKLQRLYVQFMMQYDPSFEYTETINCFIGVTQLLKGDCYPLEVIWDDDSVYQFISEVQKYQDNYRLSKSKFNLQKTKNMASVREYLTQLTNHYARLLFVRLDLHYRQDSNISISKFAGDIKSLCERLSNKKGCFKGLEGFAWALEHGGKTDGFHCHLLLIYNGAKRNNGWYLAKEAGMKWQEITEGYGTYFSCHDPRRLQDYQRQGRLGVGMIHRNDEEAVANAIRTATYLAYLTKYDQRLKVKIPNMRTFGHGSYRSSRRRGLIQ